MLRGSPGWGLSLGPRLGRGLAMSLLKSGAGVSDSSDLGPEAADQNGVSTNTIIVCPSCRGGGGGNWLTELNAKCGCDCAGTVGGQLLCGGGSAVLFSACEAGRWRLRGGIWKCKHWHSTWFCQAFLLLWRGRSAALFYVRSLQKRLSHF
jgi:hypothetical protein